MAIEDLITSTKGSAIWHEHTQATGSDAVATRAAEPGRRHFIYNISCDFEGTLSDSQTITVDFGGTTTMNFEVADSRDICFGIGVPLGENEKLDVTVPGVTGTQGSVTVVGFTIDV